MRNLLLAFGIAMLVSGLTTLPVRWMLLWLGALDRPGERSSHRIPTPRGGGLAILIGATAAILWFIPIIPETLRLGLIIAAVAGVSFLDDFHSLSFKTRLAVQTAAAVAVVVTLDVPVRSLGLPGLVLFLPRLVGIGLAILFIVATCNFYNFMDGINGLAAGQSALAAATLSVLLSRSGCEGAAIVAAAVCGAAAGFLPHNFPWARIFMGDVGSVTLGFVLAVLSQVAHARGGVNWFAVILVHAAFLFDAVFTLLKRAWRGEAIVKPHREHNYQLLVRSGWSHATVTFIVLFFSAGCCAAACISARVDGWAQWVTILGPVAAFAGYAVMAHAEGTLTGPGGVPVPTVGRPTGGTCD